MNEWKDVILILCKVIFFFGFDILNDDLRSVYFMLGVGEDIELTG